MRSESASGTRCVACAWLTIGRDPQSSTTADARTLSSTSSSWVRRNTRTRHVRAGRIVAERKPCTKGVLDNLATRGFAEGTNAWTATDHTAYTISTAGGQGFLQLLPVYVDHILYPTLTKSSFTTEVRMHAAPTAIML